MGLGADILWDLEGGDKGEFRGGIWDGTWYTPKCGSRGGDINRFRALSRGGFRSRFRNAI